jgi:Bacteriophage translational regulator
MENVLVEVTLNENVNEKVVIETLSRIGIASKKEKILWPSCYLFSEDGKYFIAHFKQMFMIKNEGYDNISIQDLERRNAIIFCLKSWGLIDVDDKEIEPHDIFVFILPFSEKKNWSIQHKFKMRSNEY